MTASIIDGKQVANQIKQSIQQQLIAKRSNRPPGLAVVLLGEDYASTVYVTNKRKACKEVGFESFAYNLSNQTTENELLTLIRDLNQNENVHGILVQLPLPPHINTTKIIEEIAPHKDVDGFHPYNFGRLAQGLPTLRPCTPLGVMKLLEYYQLPVTGKHAVVIGASNIVGRPMALEFLLAKATVTICHSLTEDIEQYIRAADIIVSATGVRNIVDVDWLSKNQVIFDIGTHRTADNKSCGDIDFDAAKNKVAWITPVPGGVGPMTVAMLLQNTLLAWSMQNKLND